MSAKAPPTWAIIALATLMPLGMHIIVPVFPQVAADLGASGAQVQLSLTVYVISIALGQLLYGPISDRFGRLRPLRAGLVAQFVGSIIAVLATDVWLLIAGRVIQGVGSCAGLVLGRAMIRDTSSAEKSAPVFAYISTALGTAAAVSPVLGAFLSSWGGWRWSLGFTALVGALLFLLTFRLRETHGGRADLAGPLTMLRDLVHLLRLPQFAGSMVGFSFPGMAFFAFLAVAPSLGQDRLRLSVETYSYYYSSIPLAYMAGSFLAGRLLPRIGSTRAARWSLVTSTGLAIASVLLYQAGGLTAWWLFAPMTVLNICQAFAVPALMTRAISADPKLIGSAAGLLGFCQMSLAAVGTQLISVVGGEPPSLAAITLVCTTLAMAGGLWGLRERRS